MKKIAIWLSILVILMPFVPYLPIETVEAADSNMQTLSQPVVSTSVNANPYIAYWQLDNGSYRVASSYTGEKAVASSGGLPVETVMAERLYMDNYPASSYYIEGYQSTHEYSHSQVSNRRIIGITPGENTSQAYTEPPERTTIIAYSRTGGYDPERLCEPYNSTGKLVCKYPYTFVLQYSANIEISKRITAKSDATIGVGDTVKVTASVETKTGKQGTFGGSIDVSKRADQTTWTSDRKAVATVDATGNVTGVSTGTAKVCARWIKEDQPFGTWNIIDCVKVTVLSSDEPYLGIEIAPLCYEDGQTNTVEIKVTLYRTDGTSQDVSTHSGTKYYTGSSYATLNKNKITAKGVGQIEIRVDFQSANGGDPIFGIALLKITDCGSPPEDPPPNPNPGGDAPACSYNLVPGGVSSTMTNSYLNANPTGKIESQTGEFDVVLGIPSSEQLRTEVTAPEYLFNQRYDQQTGQIIYSLTVTKDFTLEWEEKGEGEDAEPVTQSETVTESITVDIPRNYSYWNVTTFDIWTAFSALIKNYALPNGESLMMYSNPITANASYVADVNSHVFPSDCPEISLPGETINGGDSKPSIPDFSGEAKSAAEAQVQPPNVKNDSAVFKGTTLMSDTLTSGGQGPTPSNIPMPSDITLQKNNLLIDPLKTNYWQSPSTGIMTYQGVFGLNGTPAQKDIPFEVNVVTVHTPVVIYAEASDDKEHDQRTNPPERSTPPNPDVDRHAFVLDRPFTVKLPTVGPHRDIPGYGNRDFSKYIKEKQVRFPFDVYTETKAAFYPANTWITIPVDIDEVEFFLPVWVPEGEYTVDYRAFAINALTTGDFGGHEEEANITIPNPIWNVPPAGTLSAAHTAIDSIEVDVIGRLYDFRVTDVTDFNWKNTFRNSDGVTPNGTSYWVGTNGIDGASRGLDSKFTLPLRQGSTIEGYSNVAVKTGYKFRFNMKTKGNMMDDNDAIRINPTFYFVTKDGTRREKVDLYYKKGINQFVKIGSAEDDVNREVILNENFRNVPQEELQANADYYYRHQTDFKGVEELAKNKFATSFTRDYIKIHSKENTITGPYGWQILNWNLRTYMGPEENEVPNGTMIPAEDIVSAEQTWYGEYSIPAESYAVVEGTNLAKVGLNTQLSDNSPIFLRDGYIIVNFNIETIDNGDIENPRLQYIDAPLNNQWFSKEGFARSFTDSYGNTFNSLDGDVIYYHAEKEASSTGDYDANVTH